MKDYFSPADELLATTKSILGSERYNIVAEEEIGDDIVRNAHPFKSKHLFNLQSWFDKKLEEVEATRVVGDVKPGKKTNLSLYNSEEL